MSESFVAISQAVNPLDPDGFSVYGEDSLSTILTSIRWNSSSGNPRRRPDLVGYWSAHNNSLAFILEAKLVYIDETNIQSTLDSLAQQLENAHSVMSNVPLIGMVFIASSPNPTRAAQEGVRDVNNLLADTLSDADGCTWVDGQPGRILTHLDQVSPPWRSFNCYSTLAISARVRR